jgi:hypothetical protein
MKKSSPYFSIASIYLSFSFFPDCIGIVTNPAIELRGIIPRWRSCIELSADGGGAGRFRERWGTKI